MEFSREGLRKTAGAMLTGMLVFACVFLMSMAIVARLPAAPRGPAVVPSAWDLASMDEYSWPGIRVPDAPRCAAEVRFRDAHPWVGDGGDLVRDAGGVPAPALPVQMPAGSLRDLRQRMRDVFAPRGEKRCCPAFFERRSFSRR